MLLNDKIAILSFFTYGHSLCSKPDFNPIKKAWSVLKIKVRKIVAQQDNLVDEALDLAFKEMY